MAIVFLIIKDSTILFAAEDMATFLEIKITTFCIEKRIRRTRCIGSNRIGSTFTTRGAVMMNIQVFAAWKHIRAI